ncbi:hypothetical protein EKO27_g6524 [Xylaria grammica]|uniref:Ketoreductase (KR) domain-containing protein n=1 Tax=Xylaria grammica TaxID=363999 RepID=A0A439D2A9_9PEZI|nr:hypothetical protein EKO27_g6524 [Xylaria grammica]
MPPIAGHSVLILGGSSGIGFSVAKLCLAENSRVAIASSRQAKVDDAVKRLKEAFPNAKHQPVGYTIDLSSEAVEKNLEELLSKVTNQGTEPLDHIITTAGKPDVRPIADATSRISPTFLREGPSASIILTSGQVAEKPYPGYSVFAAYAAAQHGLARSLAYDLAPRRVNCVSPGATETEMWGEYREMIRGISAEKSLLGKAGSPDEVAEAYVYLMKNTDATGSVVSSNAGSTLK